MRPSTRVDRVEEDQGERKEKEGKRCTGNNVYVMYCSIEHSSIERRRLELRRNEGNDGGAEEKLRFGRGKRTRRTRERSEEKKEGGWEWFGHGLCASG